MFLSFVSFLFIVTVLVAIHEAGHFIAARIFGVGIKEFAVGFGKKLLSKQTADGTLYSIRVLPLGGFLALKDNRVDALVEHAANKSSNSQPQVPEGGSFAVKGLDMQDISRLQQTLIYLAGPLANVLLGIAILMVIGLSLGVPAPILTYVEPGSQAYRNGVKPGDVLVSVNDIDIYSQRMWIEADIPPTSSLIEIKFRNPTELDSLHNAAAEYSVDFLIPAADNVSDTMNISQLENQLGFSTSAAFLPPVFAAIVAGSAAEKAGLQAGDQVLSVEGTQIFTARQWSEAIRAKAGLPTNIILKKSDDSLADVVITPTQVTDSAGDTIGQAGTLLDNSNQLVSLSISKALSYAVLTVWQGFLYTGIALSHLLQGQGNSEDYVGIVGIAQISGQAVVNGIYSTLFFMAMLSVSVGLFNLLPLPILDGGHIVRLGVESVMRRSLSIRGLVMYQSIGLIMILVIFTLTLYFDINKLI